MRWEQKSENAKTAPEEKGGYAMSPDSADINKLLSRSRELADRQRGGDR